MIFFFILVILLIAAYVLISLFAPQTLPWYRPHLILDRNDSLRVEPTRIKQPVIMEGLAEPESDFNISLEENVTRLEGILNEKNRMIEKLQKELTAEKAHRGEFEKVKAIMDEEIKNLKTKNRELKSQKGERNE